MLLDKKKQIAALVAVTALTACQSPDSGNTAQAAPDRATASPTATTSETVTTVVETPEPTETESWSETSIADEHGVPSAEQVETAKQGIPGHLSLAEAVAYAGNIMNIHNKSGTVEFGAPGEFIETPESILEGDEILKALYGPSYGDGSQFDNIRYARTTLSGHAMSSEILGNDVDIYLEFTNTAILTEDEFSGTVEYDGIRTDNLGNENLDGLEADRHVTATLAKDEATNTWYVLRDDSTS